MGIAENINNAISELITTVNTIVQPKSVAKKILVDNVALTLQTLFKNNDQIKSENKDLAKALAKQTGYTKIAKTVDFDKSMELLHDYINDYKVILNKYLGSNATVIGLTALQLSLKEASKRLPA